jgi:hypothetical protein
MRDGVSPSLRLTDLSAKVRKMASTTTGEHACAETTRRSTASVKGVVAVLLASVFIGLAGCSGTVAKPNAESQFCSFIFSVGEESASSAIATTRGTGDNFSDAGLRAAAEHFTAAVASNNAQALANSESQVEVACKRLDYWHPPADAP